ncbi:MAG: hypothetical protein AB8B85_23195 [Paracoccaceae bacterium]
MSHNLPHTIIRSGSFVFNGRVPKSIKAGFGCEQVRIKLGKDEHKTGVLAEKLTMKLDQLWGSPIVRPMNPERLLEVVTPSQGSSRWTMHWKSISTIEEQAKDRDLKN